MSNLSQYRSRNALLERPPNGSQAAHDRADLLEEIDRLGRRHRRVIAFLRERADILERAGSGSTAVHIRECADAIERTP